MLAFLGLLLPGAVQLAMKIADLYTARQAANTELEKAQIDAAIKSLENQRDVILKSQDNPWTAKIYWSLVVAAASGPIVYISKIFLMDKVLASLIGKTPNIFWTDPLDDNLWKIVAIVFGFLFVSKLTLGKR